jgi:hypothetical protein
VEHVATIFKIKDLNPENGGIIFLRNIGTYTNRKPDGAKTHNITLQTHIAL